MFERVINNTEAVPAESETTETIDQLDNAIADALQRLEASGLNMQRWNEEYENLSEDVAVFEDFYTRLTAFQQQREDALVSFTFEQGISDESKEYLRNLDREVMRAYKDHQNFLGNGASAEVYAMEDRDKICVKFITSQEQYNENNHIRTEFELLSHVHESTKNSKVKTPYPAFARIHATEGHSYGMEKVNGASLSQILESPDQYPDLVALAQEIDRDALADTLQEFVAEMHTSGVVHCDLYKRNLMLDRAGNLFVIDFGKGKRLNFPDEREDERKSDLYNAKQSIQDFFAELDLLTN